MFGITGTNPEPPKYVKRTRPLKMTHDIQLATLQPGIYGHMAREPNTNYHVRLLDYKQKQQAAELAFTQSEKGRLNADKITIKYDKHADKKIVQRQINDRVQTKLAQYDRAIEIRREKLRDLLCREERQFYHETVDRAQCGHVSAMDAMRKRVNELEMQKERARLEVVRDKKIQQYSQRCLELRPVIARNTVIETKCTQLRQIVEKKARKESEREMDAMWYDLMMKEIDAKMEKEMQDLLRRNENKKELMEVWQKQIEGKKLLENEVKMIADEDRIEMVKLQDQMRRDEIEALDAKRRKRDERAKELLDQIRIQEEFLAQRKKEEIALDQAYVQLAQTEIDRANAKTKDYRAQAKRETAIYRNYLRELDAERKTEEHNLNLLLVEHRKALERKQDAVRCKLLQAKQKLQKDVMQGRAEQVDCKRHEAEILLRLKKVDNELLRMDCAEYERLQAEEARMRAESAQQYRDELSKQIQYNDVLKERERQELQRQLAAGLLEEEKYQKFVDDLIQGKLKEVTAKHPFRQVLENKRDQNCSC